ncbi:hypothetical protein DDF62_09620 [Caulobacter radicis]|nr:hypothetical protein DDF62_09620 [Caulobacter radicis]
MALVLRQAQDEDHGRHADQRAFRSSALQKPNPELVEGRGFHRPFSSRSRAALSCAARPAVPPLSGWAKRIRRA